MIFQRSLEDTAKRKLVWEKNKTYKILSTFAYLIGIVVIFINLKFFGLQKETLISILIVYLGIYFLLEKIYNSSVIKLSESEINLKKEEILNSKLYKATNEKSKIFKIIGISFIVFFVLIILFIAGSTIIIGISK